MSEVDGDAGARTLFVSSVADGYHSMVVMLSKTIPGCHLSIRVSRPDVEYPGTFLTAIADNRAIRTVYSMRDVGKWVFYEDGVPLEFETPSNYQSRLKRDRLNLEIIASYLRKIGYGSLEADYWISNEAPAWLLCEKDFRLATNTVH